MDDSQPGPSGQQQKLQINHLKRAYSPNSPTNSDDSISLNDTDTTTNKTDQENISDKKEIQKTEESPVKKNIFKCFLCDLTEYYDYLGTEPPFSKHILLKEECYVLEDPFSAPGQGEILILGANCFKCQRSVCKDVVCSFYFDGTYCAKCLETHLQKFPDKVQKKIVRIKEQNLHKIAEVEHDYHNLKNIQENV